MPWHEPVAVGKRRPGPNEKQVKIFDGEEESEAMVVKVFDAVGGDTLERSWGVLKPGGRMITIAAGSDRIVAG